MVLKLYPEHGLQTPLIWTLRLKIQEKGLHTQNAHPVDKINPKAEIDNPIQAHKSRIKQISEQYK